MEQLKLAALDEDDLAVISAQVQDAVLKVGDILFFPPDRHLVITMNRFAWDLEEDKRRKRHERRRAALSFARVSDLKVRNIRQDAKDAVLSLLAVEFEAGEAPAGRINLLFAGGGTLSFEVECIEAQLADLGAAWATDNKPHHTLD
ncbi:DUF2948 family protein [Stappia sp. ES.058]|uniref:DUF2948 family protein n=1 Tax=Stappia sp. ES.058 TaxID=1881061 RepID=UPI00087C80CF|nr:DUF2948 family protein [Stappia sp. ES.058]SDT95068.1 Protein of unknown function [Stappia sp. ES.058]